MYLRVFRSAVGHFNANADVFWISFRILDKNIEITIVVEDACVDQFILGFLLSAPATVLLDQLRIRKFRLRILVQVPHVRVGRRAVEIEIILLNVFAVVRLR